MTLDKEDREFLISILSVIVIVIIGVTHILIAPSLEPEGKGWVIYNTTLGVAWLIYAAYKSIKLVNRY